MFYTDGSVTRLGFNASYMSGSIVKTDDWREWQWERGGKERREERERERAREREGGGGRERERSVYFKVCLGRDHLHIISNDVLLYICWKSVKQSSTDWPLDHFILEDRKRWQVSRSVTLKLTLWFDKNRTFKQQTLKNLSISCSTDFAAVRLVNGSVDGSGVLQYWSGQQWSEVCTDNWHTEDTAVVCTQLGYPL